MALESYSARSNGSGQNQTEASATSALADVEKAASAALEKAEAFIKENPVAAAAGIGLIGAVIGMAIARRATPAPIDRRIVRELNRQSDEIMRAVRRNANSFSNSDTGQAVESFITNLLTNIAKVPDLVTKQVNSLTK